jgi:hypothetical protein
MRIKILVMTVLALSVILATAWAADISGTWKGEMAGMRGGGTPMEFIFTAKAAGNKLTGTWKGPQGEGTEISDGKIDGDKVSFTVKSAGKMAGMKINYKGTVSGDEMKLTMEFDMSGVDFSQMGGGMGGPPPGGGGGMGGPGGGGPGGGGGRGGGMGGPGGGGGMPPMELTLKKQK